MILGRVIGEIHGTIKHPFYEGRKLLVIEETLPTGAPTGDYLIAADAVGAGADERVLVLDEGNGARQVFEFDAKLNRDDLRAWMQRLLARPHHLGS